MTKKFIFIMSLLVGCFFFASFTAYAARCRQCLHYQDGIISCEKCGSLDIEIDNKDRERYFPKYRYSNASKSSSLSSQNNFPRPRPSIKNPAFLITEGKITAEDLKKYGYHSYASSLNYKASPNLKAKSGSVHIRTGKFKVRGKGGKGGIAGLAAFLLIPAISSIADDGVSTADDGASGSISGVAVVIIVFFLIGVIWICVEETYSFCKKTYSFCKKIIGISATEANSKEAVQPQTENSKNADSQKKSLRPMRMGSCEINTVAAERTKEQAMDAISSNSFATNAAWNEFKISKEHKSKDKNEYDVYWYHEGMLFCDGTDGRSVDYNKAIECFQKAKEMGCNEADEWLTNLKSLTERK